MSNSTIELVTYQLKTGKTREDLAAIQPAFNELLQAQPGFIYRSGSFDEAGLVHDICYWQSLAELDAFAEVFMQHAAGQALLALCEEGSVNMCRMPAATEVMGTCSEAA